MAERRTVRLRRAESRSMGSSPPGYAEAFGVQPTASGAYVSPHLAENLSAVYACVAAVSSALASLPALVYHRTLEGRTEAPTHPVARLLRRPNPDQTWPDWMEWTVAQVLSRGNALSIIETDGAGRPVGLHPVPWGAVQVVRLPSGALAYDVAPSGPTRAGGNVQRRRYLAGEVFHLRDRSDDGVIGRSRVSRAPDVLGNALALQEWSGAQWRNGATPSGVLKFPSKIPSQDVADRIRMGFERNYSGSRNGGRIMILENGAEWQGISLSPEDAEVLGSRRFSVEEICRLFQVPPPIVQAYEHNTFTNAAQASLWFAQLTLTPWARKIEAEFSRSVFGAASRDTHELELDMSGLMRGDYVSRWQAHEIAVRNNILTADEVREVEGWNPRGAQGGEQPSVGGL
ncbi:phage portal protein [Roseomonas sp. WA12]